MVNIPETTVFARVAAEATARDLSIISYLRDQDDLEFLGGRPRQTMNARKSGILQQLSTSQLSLNSSLSVISQMLDRRYAQTRLREL
ncbi:hypothetical protein PYCC9005_000886 [Savitreella phatthalungensis]